MCSGRGSLPRRVWRAWAPPLRRVVIVESLAGIALPGPAIRLKNKKLMRPRRPKQYCLQLHIALWCKNQLEHSIWDESLLFSNCARSLEYSSSNTLAGLSYHICGKLEVAFKASPSSQHQHCTDEAQKAETVQLLAFWLRSKGSVSLFISIDYHGKCSYGDD